MILGGSALALIGITCLLWAFRFERVEGLPSWTFAEIRSQAPEIPGLEWRETSAGLALNVRMGANHPKVGAKLSIPGMVPASFLHMRFRLSASALMAGGQPWEDGRLMVDWQSADDPTRVETDPVGTIRDDIEGDFQDIVVGSDHPPALPSLRVEHLGRSGEFTIADLKIEVIRERQVWRIGRWVLCIAWWIWGLVFIRCWPRIGVWRAALAGGIWVLMGAQFVIPGPWKIQRPIYPKFQLGAESPARHEVSGKPAQQRGADPVPVSGALQPLGEMPVQGSLVLKLKYTIQRARPLLHMLMLFAPMCLLSALVGRFPAFWLCAATAILIEVAQLGFGYGFGWDDIGDLTSDFAGIALGGGTTTRLAVWWRERFPDWRMFHSPDSIAG